MKRYDFHCDGFDNFDMRESRDGEYVLFDDLVKAIATARAEALREAADRIISYIHHNYIWSDECIRAAILADKQESTCPACGRLWDMSRFNACECGASLTDKQEGEQ